MLKKVYLSKGQSLIELLMVIALCVILIPALLTAFLSTREGRAQQKERAAALSLLKEAYEAVRSVKERDWTAFAVNETYHPIISGPIWELAPGQEAINGMTRSIVISDVYRNSSGEIVTSGGSRDPSTKKVLITVAWNSPFPSFVDLPMYLSRYKSLIYKETTEEEFNQGTKTNVAVTKTDDGEVILGAGGYGDWCRPNDFIRAQMNLPENGAARDVKAIEGKAFTGTSQAGSGHFVEISISNTNPPVPSIDSQLAGYETNDVFIDGNFAYIATNDISRDVVIIDLTTNTEVGYFNDRYWFGTAQGIYVVGNTGYVTIGARLHTFDLSSKEGERPELDSIFLWGTGYRLMVIGNYAYVAVDWGWSELRLVNVSNPRDLRLAAGSDVNGEKGQEVYVNDAGTRAYLATSLSPSKNELFIINTDVSAEKKDNPSYNLPVISAYDSAGMNPKGVTAVTANKVILVGAGGEEYQVIDITNEGSPTRCGGIQVDSNIYGVSAVLEGDGDAYSYIVTGDSDSEFKIIEGGPGGQYSDTGTFESRTFDATNSAAFNRFDASAVKPDLTDISFQVAIADPVDGGCGNAYYVFVGPDDTPETHFATSSGVIPFDDDEIGFENPGRCLRYKAYLSTEDRSRSPVLLDISFNYSP